MTPWQLTLKSYDLKRYSSSGSLAELSLPSLYVFRPALATSSSLGARSFFTGCESPPRRLNAVGYIRAWISRKSSRSLTGKPNPLSKPSREIDSNSGGATRLVVLSNSTPAQKGSQACIRVSPRSTGGMRGNEDELLTSYDFVSLVGQP